MTVDTGKYYVREKQTLKMFVADNEETDIREHSGKLEAKDVTEAAKQICAADVTSA